MQIKALATYLGAQLHVAAGSPAADLMLTGVGPLATASATQVSFLANPEYAKLLATTQAAAVITAAVAADCQAAQLIHANPYWAFAKTAQLFFKPEAFPVGISPAAFIASTARLGAGVTVLPGAFIGEEADIGERVVIYPGVYVGRSVKIGADSVLRANVVVEHGVSIGARVLIHAGSVIGADGFGFAPGDDSIAKIPQIGGVEIGDDVEIGGLCTIDRGAMASTKVGAGTKLDSHVHIGHNAVTGEHCMLCAFSGLAGSARLGHWVLVAGHSGVTNNITVADRVTLGGMSGLTKSVHEKGTYLGFPAKPASQWRRQEVLLRRLPELEARVKELESLVKSQSAVTSPTVAR